ncbi:MAG: RidA family protein [Planctomycetes bacterium]|nr:RidA family protein [Planctomycetota bacterium]
MIAWYSASRSSASFIAPPRALSRFACLPTSRTPVSLCPCREHHNRRTAVSTPEKRVQELHLTLPPAPKPVAVYKTAVKFGTLLFVSGHGPLKADKTMITGRVGKDLTLEQGKEAARQVGLAILATVKDHLGSLDKIKRLIKTFGMVNSTDDFLDHPKVINGFSELMKDVFGEDAGVGARSAVGHNVLPGNIAVEVECIFEVEA